MLPVGALLAVLAPAVGLRRRHRRLCRGFVVEPPADDGASAVAERKLETRRQDRSSSRRRDLQNEATPVVLIHGFGGDSDNWLFNIDELAKDRPVYAIDLPGHGKSTKALIDGDLDDLTGSVARSPRRGRRREGSSRRAIRLARRSRSRPCVKRPERVASVAGIAPAGLDDEGERPTSSRASSPPRSARTSKRAPAPVCRSGPGLGADDRGRAAFQALEGAREAFARSRTRISLGAGRRRVSGTWSRDRVPIPVVWGERDAILDPAAPGPSASVEVLWIADVGHMPHLEAASAVNGSSPRISTPPIDGSGRSFARGRCRWTRSPPRASARRSPSRAIRRCARPAALVPAAIWVMQPILPAAIRSGAVLSILATLRSRSWVGDLRLQQIVGAGRAATEVSLGRVEHDKPGSLSSRFGSLRTFCPCCNEHAL